MSSTALVATTPKDYEGLLLQREDRLAQLLAGTDIDPQRFIGMTVQAIAREPKLLAPDIDRDSVLLAILSTAELGLTPTGRGGTHLVPFHDKQTGKKKVQAITDWGGLIKMAQRTGQLRAAWAHVVYEGDEFTYQLGDRPSLTHVPTLDASTRGNITHTYAVLHLTNGERVFEVMTLDEVEAIRKRSRAKDSGPWVTDYVEMVRKTPLRRLFKWNPAVVTPQLEAALQAEDDWEDAARGPSTALATVSPRRQRLLDHLQGAETASTAPEAADGDVPPPTAESGSSVEGAGRSEATDE